MERPLVQPQQFSLLSGSSDIDNLKCLPEAYVVFHRKHLPHITTFKFLQPNLRHFTLKPSHFEFIKKWYVMRPS